MKSLSAFFMHTSRGWVAALATACFVLFMVLVLPGQAAEAEAVSAGEGSPDTSFWYTASDLYRFAEAYGEAGREAYVRARWTFDLIYPLVYAFFLIAGLSWLFAYVFPPDSTWRNLNLVPFLGMVFDYLENIATSLVMARYPQLTPLAACAAPLLTLAKWVFVLGSFLCLIIGLIMAVHKRLMRPVHQD
jgi:NADH:ubiquinone oxidoreductase subunit 3 (subunit A)